MSDPIREFFDRDVQTDGPRVIFTFGSHGEAIGALNAARAVADRNIATALHDAAMTLLTGRHLLPDEAMYILRRGDFEFGLTRVIEITARERKSIPRERPTKKMDDFVTPEAAEAQNAALPARGVGVPGIDGWVRRLRKTEEAGHVHHLSKADRLAIADFLAALAPTEPPEEIGILRARVEDQATEIARLTRIIQMQPPARTTDAAQAREAALREAAEIALRHRSKVQINEELWHEGQDWAAKRISEAILALIGDSK